MACASGDDRGQHLARRAVRCDLPAGRPADDLAVVLRSGELGRCHRLAAVAPRDLAPAGSDHRGRDDLFSAVHVHRLPADLRAHARRAAQRDAPDGHAVVPARHSRRVPGRRCRDRDRDGSVSARGDHVFLFRSAASRLATGWGGPVSEGTSARSELRVAAGAQAMDYLVTMPRRVVTVYLPLGVFLFVLLFPFYWMVMTALKPNEELLSHEGNPFWVHSPTLVHVKKLRFDTAYPDWLWNTLLVSVVATFLSLVASVLAAYAIERLRFRGARYVGMSIFLAYLVPPSILFIPLAAIVYKLQLFDTRLALILTYPTFLIPFCTWLLMGYFKSIPVELEECALIDGASRWQILVKIILPLSIPGLISAFIFCFTLCWNEFIYALTFLQSTQNKTVPVAIVNEFVDGDIYRWGSLMAGALAGSLPLVILYAFFVEHYVSASATSSA